MGHPSPEAIVSSSQTFHPYPSGNGEPDQKPKTLVIETSVGDCRLWIEVLRNLSKDLSKHGSIYLSESTVAGIGKHSRHRNSSSDMSIDPRSEQQQIDQNFNRIVAFTCSHTFPLVRFQTKILQDFVQRVQDFPLSIPLTLKHLQLHYKQSAYIPSSCPYCVFQYLRKIQLQQCPNVPIRPWNPA